MTPLPLFKKNSKSHLISTARTTRDKLPLIKGMVPLYWRIKFVSRNCQKNGKHQRYQPPFYFERKIWPKIDNRAERRREGINFTQSGRIQHCLCTNLPIFYFCPPGISIYVHCDCFHFRVQLWMKEHTDQALTRFSISRKSREEMVHFFLSRAGELNFHFSRCSRMSRF